MKKNTLYYGKISYSEDSEKIYKKLGNSDALMSRTDHDFLCGLLQKKRPSKILEIGVYAGGTTAVILDCLQYMDLTGTEVYSVDLCRTLDTGKKVGYLTEEAGVFLRNIHRYHLYTGVTAADVVEKLTEDGQKFDFVIIDTVHYLPGELLDFLCVFPFLEENAVVVLHDVMLNHAGGGYKDRCEATKVLFDVSSGNKIWNWDVLNDVKNANIAAIEVTEETGRNIVDIISALGLSWNLNPGREILDRYRNIICKYYTQENLKLFDQMVSVSLDWWECTHKSITEAVVEIVKTWCMGSRRLWIFGYTGEGKALLDILEIAGMAENVSGFLITDQCKSDVKEIYGKKVFRFQDISYNRDLDHVILSTDNKEVSDFLSDKHIDYIMIPNIIKKQLYRWKNPTSLYH